MPGAAAIFATYVIGKVTTGIYRMFFGKKEKWIRKSPTYKIRETEETLSHESPVPIVYGYNKVEGHVIYREQNDERIFDLAVGLCEGEIEEIKNIKINDNPIDEIPTRSLTDTTISFSSSENRIYDSNNRFKSIGFVKSGDVPNYIIVKGSEYNDGAYKIDDVWNTVLEGSIKITDATLIQEPAGRKVTLSTSIGYRKYNGTCSQDGDDIFKKGMIKLNPTEDAYVWQGAPDAKYGTIDGLVVRIRGRGMTYQCFPILKFNLGVLPAGLVIDKAVLKLPVYQHGRELKYGEIDNLGRKGKRGRVALFRALSETGWTEDTVTWNDRPTIGNRISSWYETKLSGDIQTFEFNKEYGLPFLNAQYNNAAEATFFIKDKGDDPPPADDWYEIEYTSKESVYKHAFLEIHYSGGTPQGYRNTAYIALTLDANEEKIGGSTPRVTAEVKGRLIKNWNGSEWQTTYNNNPIWCIRDLLTNTRYGCGIGESDLDLDSFKTAADYCDASVEGENGEEEKRFECDVVIDDYAEAYEIVQELLLTIRGRLFPLDGKIHIAIESPGSVDHTFTEDNILPDSFSYFEVDKNEIPNTIRVLYTNASKDFKLDYVQVEDEIDLETRDRVIDEIQCYSINRRSQALRLANFLLWKGKRCNKSCTFRVSINNCDVAVNDICQITHSIPNWSAKKFRIVQVSESFRDEIELVCEEYDADIYYEGGIPHVYNETPDLPPVGERPPFVTSLTLAETHEILDDGTYIPQIIVSFTEPDYVYPLHYQIWLMKEGNNWKPKNLISTNTCIISVDEVADYYVKVQSISLYSDCESDFEDSPQSSIALVGQSETPSIPTVAGIEWSTDGKAEWTTGRIYHKGTAYEIDSGSTTDQYIYFEPSTSKTALLHSNTRPTMNADTWIMATYDSDADEITPAQGFKLLHAAILQAHTITANEIEAHTITANEIEAHTITANEITTGELITETAQIKDAIITDAKISGVITIEKTEAKCTDPNADQTSANPQDYGWITGVKPPVDADVTLSELNGGLSLTGGGLTLSSGGATIESGNFEHGVAGWRIYYDGSAEFQNIYARGTMVTALSGQRIVINSSDNTLRFHTDTAENVVIIDDLLYGIIPGIQIGESTHGGIFVATNGSVSTYMSHDTIQMGGKEGSPAQFRILHDSCTKIIVSAAGINVSDGGVYVSDEITTSGFVQANTGYRIGDTEIIDSSKNITTNIGTVDGVDISAHAANADAHHAESHTIASHTTKVSHDDMNQSYSTFTAQFRATDNSLYTIHVEDGVITSHEYES